MLSKYKYVANLCAVYAYAKSYVCICINTLYRPMYKHSHTHTTHM